MRLRRQALHEFQWRQFLFEHFRSLYRKLFPITCVVVRGEVVGVFYDLSVSRGKVNRTFPKCRRVK